MPIGKGTNMYAADADTIKVDRTNPTGDAMSILCTVANLPASGSGYAVSCLAQTSDGGVYQNTGTATSATWTLIDTASGSLTLPAAATDATTTTTTSLALTQNTVTTGAGMTQALNGLTTGFGHSITHTTSVIAAGGSLLNLSSTGVDTTTTTGALLTLTSTSGVAATQVLGTFGITTGIGGSLVANSLTTGQVLKIGSSATAITTTGRLFLVNHSGATGTSATLSEFASAATDETIVLSVTASAALAAGKVLNLSGAAVTTGTILDISDNTATTTGKIVNIASNSSDTGTRSLVTIAQSHASASGATPLTITNANATKPLIAGTATATSTNYFKFMTVNGVTLWIGNGTTANTSLSGTAGDILFNGGSGKPEYCTGTTNWTALV